MVHENIYHSKNISDKPLLSTMFKFWTITTYLWSNGQTSNPAWGLCPGKYTVTITEDCIEKFIDTADVLSSPNPAVNIPTAQVIDISCYGGDNGSATVFSSGGTPPYTYTWFPSGDTTKTITNLKVGTYTVLAKDANGCANVDTITIDQPPQLIIKPLPTVSIYHGQSATITAIANGGIPPYTYLWDGTSAGASYTVSPLVTTIYTVVATDSNGCTAMAYVTVEVLCGEVFVPDAFSPNGDGQNDYLYVRSNCIKTMDLVIFDRWGNKVFESTSQSTPWDGTYNGKALNAGTYTYYLNAAMLYNAIVQRKGNVTLVR